LLEKDAQLGILKDSSQELYAYYVIYKWDPVPKDSLVSIFIEDPTMLDNTYYLYDVYVNPNYRGLGMGKLFLEHIIEWYEKVYLHVRETNPAIHLYKNLGFVFIDRVIDYYSVDCTNALVLLYIAD
jgi:ribosomal protein S18 acetylase RimI-like enzyme